MYRRALWHSLAHLTVPYRVSLHPGPSSPRQKVASPGCNQIPAHITPLRAQPTLSDLLVVERSLLIFINGGITAQDEVWLWRLPKYEQLVSEFDSKGDIHCEAALMALTTNPSTSFSKEGIENVSPFNHCMAIVSLWSNIPYFPDRHYIGLSWKKCCYRFHLLSETLQKTRLSTLQSSRT